MLAEFSNRVEAQDRDQINRLILIAGLDEPDMIDKLFAFAQEARQVATKIAGMITETDSSTANAGGKKGPVESESMMALSAYFDEFSGESNVTPPVTTGRKVVEHGAIVAALAKALGGGANLKKNQAIDLAATYESRTDLYEVKTSADTQSVYTGVGQLLIHGEGVKALWGLPVRRLLVLPKMPRKDLIEPIAKALEVTIVTYQKQSSGYTFEGI